MSVLDKQYGEIDTTKDMRAIVVDRTDPKGQSRIAVVIPKLMPSIDPVKPTASKKSISIDKEGLQNKEVSAGINSSISTSNHFWARPVRGHTGNSRVPYVNDTVYVFFEDGDPSKCYYKPYAPTLNGDAAAMDTIGATSDQFNPSNKPNIHVIDTFKDGTTIYYNENGGTRQYGMKMADGTCITVDNSAGVQQILLHTSKNHNIVIDQTNQNITAITEKGHKLILDDKNQNISMTTTGKHSMVMDDKNQAITTTSTGGHSVALNDKEASVSVKCSDGSQTLMKDGKVSTSNSGGASVVLDGSKVSIN